MQRLRNWIPSVLGAGLLLGAAGCQGDGDSADGKGPNGNTPGDVPEGSVASALLQAEDCPDLLSKIQEDAIMKAKLAAVRFKLQVSEEGKDIPVDAVGDPSGGNGGGSTGSATGDSEGAPRPSAPGGGAPPQSGGDDSAGSNGSVGGADGDSAGPRGPTGASDTNTQVEGVDEADFVKLVKGGERMFLLHGSKLMALKSWPADETAIDGGTLNIEGQPSEMFVTADGKRAVIFSAVYDYGGAIGGGTGGSNGGKGDVCSPEYCGGYGQSFAKVTVADVSGAAPKALRELYYEGSYLSSRRYAGDKQDVVRAVFQAYPRYQNLFYPEIEARDAWGRLYADDVIDSQLQGWVERTSASIKATVLEDWLPVVREASNGKLVTIEPSCDGYYVPNAGLTDYGMTHVLSMDINDDAGKLGGVTIMGAASTVYSNAEHLVLAQPDYRWSDNSDFGLVDQQQTALHMFAIEGASTKYAASGWVPGHVPANNSQFAIDEQDGAIRIATTGWVRDNPNANRDQEAFWRQHSENRVYTTRAVKNVLEVAGKTSPFGHENERITAARFVGDRGYIVTFRNTDPLIVVDLKNPEKPAVLGEIEIPGFSEYMHPLDQDHIMTIGESGQGGKQLQMFDVSDPKNIPEPKRLDFGQGSSSEAAYNHKAFTYFAEQKLLAVPLYTYGYGSSRQQYGSSLQVIEVSTKTGFKLLGAVDHAPMYGQQNCGYCDQQGCYDYSCGYSPEVRRGHFVTNADDTFVYSISYGGVLVNNLDDLAKPVATVQLPQPTFSEGSWHGGGGVSSGGGSTGGSNTGGVDVAPPPDSDGPAPAP